MQTIFDRMWTLVGGSYPDLVPDLDPAANPCRKNNFFENPVILYIFMIVRNSYHKKVTGRFLKVYAMSSSVIELFSCIFVCKF